MFLLFSNFVKLTLLNLCINLCNLCVCIVGSDEGFEINKEETVGGMDTSGCKRMCEFDLE